MAENDRDTIQTDRLLKRVQELEQEVERLKKERADAKDSNTRESSSGAGKARRCLLYTSDAADEDISV